MTDLSLRLATSDDIEAISALMHRAITELQRGYLTAAQIQASFAGMGLDTQLIDDRTYFTVWDRTVSGELTLVGCGGWSRRATLYGGNHSAGRSAALLDPAKDRARIRAMYTHPAHTKRGIGRMILAAGEQAAKDEGFSGLEMAATMAGVPFYKRCGYSVESEWEDTNGAVAVPLCTMIKSI